tara:strand:+ start:1947 stop:2375 length:429 start_codon:yes stop_codon:yes gene_type:complete
MFRVVGFDNREHKFNFTKHNRRKYQQNKSSLHIKARDTINEVFPQFSVYEEVTLPGSKRLGRSSLLYADFFIPEIMCIVEVHGKQHYEYCSFFHKNKMDFVNAKRRDLDKIEWCELNNITIVVLPYNEEKQWKHLIQQSTSQ